MTWTDGTSRRP